ncbi:MAG: methyltransferase domain-containing protein [Alphaproteobacteria bacterium]|nr:methyltransferase domain-containing protein [Alphaproteobacteria bacterium]
MLNRQKWDSTQFHEAIAKLVAASPGDQVLDLGCGGGASLGPLLAAVGSDGKVFGLELRHRALAVATQRYAAAVDSGRLVLLQGQGMTLPFADGTFDAIVCQNVIECVQQRKALIDDAGRVLKPGGRLLLGHHDFDGILITSDDRELTRRLVHAFADYQQDWQDASDGRMGRMIPGLVTQAGFAAIEIETKLFVDLNLNEGTYARSYVKWLIDLAPEMGFDRNEVRGWASALETAASDGQFFFGLPWVGAICRKPSGEEP